MRRLQYHFYTKSREEFRVQELITYFNDEKSVVLAALQQLERFDCVIQKETSVSSLNPFTGETAIWRFEEVTAQKNS